MKKKMLVMLLAMVMVLAFTACGKFNCEMCGKESSGKKYTVTILGEKMDVCADCKKDFGR